MKEVIVYQIDSFTKEKFKGNPAGVVLNAESMTSEEMQLIARELNNSETAFVFRPDDPKENFDYHVRYFTPTTEVPSCGHATIAALYAKAQEDKLDSCTITIKTQIGILPIHIERENNDYLITMTQGKFELSPAFDTSITQRIVEALGLTMNDLDEKCPVQIASTGHSKVMIGIKNNMTLHHLTPDLTALTKLSKEIGCNGYFVFTFDIKEKDILTNGRMFAPAIGIAEDPVTGNANGPLGGYLIQNKIIETADSIFEFTGKQGEAINRIGNVKVRVSVKDNQPNIISITGNAVGVFRTIMDLK
ncbi:PhzF family phenazine biosynthesis protein [Chryseobacterium sediminis]|uniref:PhzF family phenazine biosynthesis protein n=1 Tax=Chryseobacterium sediminis TaxID=1679494 RepID=A0ABR6PXL4_9FLAO|nr:PhzF family isomerase [Chryseobacterium sediminis]MBB6329792.1 PhzF family phenazine biosynthesis protein [Chryseobacterium sediminis]